VDLQVDDININSTTRSARRGDRELELAPREFELLELLARKPDKIVSRNEIWEQIYKFDATGQSNAIEVLIARLRQKIERPDLPRLIHTRRGFGYMLKLNK
jgi:DNA-binding response OmpR family regulator